MACKLARELISSVTVCVNGMVLDVLLALALEAAQVIRTKVYASTMAAFGIIQTVHAGTSPPLALALEAAQVIRTKVYASTMAAFGIIQMVHAGTAPSPPLALALEAAQIIGTQFNASTMAAIGIIQVVHAVSAPSPSPAAQIIVGTQFNASTMAAFGILQVVHAVSAPSPSPPLAAAATAIVQQETVTCLIAPTIAVVMGVIAKCQIVPMTANAPEVRIIIILDTDLLSVFFVCRLNTSTPLLCSHSSTFFHYNYIGNCQMPMCTSDCNCSKGNCSWQCNNQCTCTSGCYRSVE